MQNEKKDMGHPKQDCSDRNAGNDYYNHDHYRYFNHNRNSFSNHIKPTNMETRSEEIQKADELIEEFIKSQKIKAGHKITPIYKLPLTPKQKNVRKRNKMAKLSRKTNRKK